MYDSLGTIRLFRWRGAILTRALAILERRTTAPWGTEHRIWEVLATGPHAAVRPTMIDISDDGSGDEVGPSPWETEQVVPMDMLPEYLDWDKTPLFDKILKGE